MFIDPFHIYQPTQTENAHDEISTHIMTYQQDQYVNCQIFWLLLVRYQRT